MRTAKFKKLFYLLIVVGIFILAAPYTARVYQLNQRYPSAQTITGTQNAPITWNGLKIELLNGELVPQESFFSAYEVIASSIFSDSLAEQYAIFSVAITKLEENESQNHFYLDYCGAEKDGWKNLISPELFQALNPNAKQVSQMSVGETQNFLLAIGLHQAAFTKQNWKNVRIDQLSLVLSIYPEKISLQYT
ncbi:MAG TPA: hypothetical protein H9943_03995 [Candidatus Ruthenibacterium avium]|mgnify:FL=1|uniref:Uncharacterized protein n=1 Tax=Candidatus Ruthenibacterium avium TaxID=2838751 RepID=A0A9D2M268_9FIRM|nr:hypothetical protein [Candidatus Ruthenibacterium avium]